MAPDLLSNRLLARELRRVLGLAEDASNAQTLVAASEQAERLAAARERGAEHALGTLGFALSFNQAVHAGYVEATQRDSLAELYATDEAAAVEVMFTKWREAA